MLNLSIVVITYNRSEFLNRTLGQLANSPFSECELWVLNNASTDSTLDVCDRWRMHLPHMQVVTHKFNIGVAANTLRAYEYGTERYKWILCDDDDLHVEHMPDLLEALRSAQYDLFRISDVGVASAEEGMVCSLRDLLHDRKAAAFWSFGFIPGLIFRSSSVAANVRYGYHYAHAYYPQLHVLLRSFGLDTQVLTTSSPVVLRGPAPTGIGSEIFVYWLKALEALPDRESKIAALRCIFRQRPFNLGMSFISDILGGRSRQKILSVWKEILVLAPALNKLIVVMNMPFIFPPLRILKMFYPLVKGKPFVKNDVDELRLSRNL